MSGLLVYFTGSPRTPGWRHAIAGAALERGWSIVEDDGTAGIAKQLENDQPSLVLSSLTAPSQILTENLKMAVVKDTPEAALSALATDQSRDALIMAAHVGSAMFAYADSMARQGAVVLDANANSLHLPLLGDVAAEAGGHIPPQTLGSLDIYHTLPLDVGTTAEWPISAFRFPISTPAGLVDTGRAAIDLTGRARTIVYGPYIHLPPGLWEAEVRALIQPDGGSAHLRFEWGANPDYVGSSAHVTRNGVYSIKLQRFWPEIRPSELVITSIQPHFHGHFELLSVSVKLLSHGPVGEDGVPD